tara:strand:+ start:1772 stop:2053 length:282 start_codon:yes stop_codon:yes gene_type:complete
MNNIINNIESKLNIFISKYRKLNQENISLKKKNDDLSLDIQKKEKEILSLNDKIKLMNISKSVDVSEEEVKESRLKINKYVREIDKCIALLNK